MTLSDSNLLFLKAYYPKCRWLQKMAKVELKEICFYIDTYVTMWQIGLTLFMSDQEKRLLGFPMDRKEFAYFRRKLNKTQRQMAHLLGVSIKTVQSYEQGWRRVPGYVGRQVFFLVSRKQGIAKRRKPCWAIKQCSLEDRKKCPAWEFQAGYLCWFIDGTICEGKVQPDWRKKMEMCRHCEVFQPLLQP